LQFTVNKQLRDVSS